MLFYKTRRKVLKKIFDNFNYYKVLYVRNQRIEVKEKQIFIDVTRLHLNRYLHVFLIFFGLRGYTVFLPKNKEVIRVLSNSKGEMSRMLEQKFIKFGFPTSSQAIRINAEQLSNDYFTPFLRKELNDEDYYIPMCEYPAWYESDNNISVYDIEHQRKRSVFMAGNIHPKLYNKIAEAGVFKITSRLGVANFLKKKEYHLDVASIEEIKSHISSSEKNKVILVDTSARKIWIQGKMLKELIIEFDFYLGLPGIEIPQAHNLIEAMSVGAIPILEKSYAELFYPPIMHEKEAIVFENLEDLNEKITFAFSMDEQMVIEMRRNVMHYYQSNLTPSAVVRHIEDRQITKIFIQAELKSLALLGRNGEN